MKQFISVVFVAGISLWNYIYGQAVPDAKARRPLQRSVLTGKVTDARTGNPLAGASVYIHELKTGAIAGGDGAYKTAAIAPGKYLVEVSSVGNETQIETIDINGTTEKNFALRESVVEQEGVTVTGVSNPTRIRQSPQPVTVLKRTELTSISASNIINALTYVPGVNAVTTGPAISKPFIRGLGYNRVVTVSDGTRQEGQQWGDEHGIEIDDYSVQRVEILKGPASLMYGSDALAGVINIQSLLPAPDGTFNVNLLSEYQSNNNLRGFYGNLASTRNGFAYNIYGSYKGAQDYKNKYDGYVFNSKFYNKDFGGMIGYSGSWGHSYLVLSNFDQHAGIIEGDRDSATGRFVKPMPGGKEAITNDGDFKKITPTVPFQHISHFKVTSDNNFSVGKSRLDLLLSYQRNRRQEFGNPDDMDVPDAYFNLTSVNYAAKLNLLPPGNIKTTVGVTGMWQGNENRGEEAIIPDYNLFDIGAFVFAQYHKDKLSISGGLRFDNRHIQSEQMLDGSDIKFESFTKNFSNISGSAGLSYQANKQLTLKMNVARGFRAPNLAELASNGAHEGTNRYEAGDKNLKSETSFQLDAGAEIAMEHISLSVYGYYNHIDRFIFYEKRLTASGQDSVVVDDDTGDELTVFHFNQNDANLYGAEANIDIHPHPLDWLHFENSFSFTRARFSQDIDGSRNVPFIPAARLTSQLKGVFYPKGKALRNAYLSFESDYTFRQAHPFTGYATETATPAYWLLNASAGTDVVKGDKTLFSIHLSVQNFSNLAWQSHLSRLKYSPVNNLTGRPGVFNQGRNFGVKVSIPLSWTIGRPS